MSIKRILIQGALVAVTAMSITACSDDHDSASKNNSATTDNKVEQTIDKAGDQLKKTGDAISDKAHKAGEVIDDKAHKAGEAIDDKATDAGNAVEDACEKAKEGMNAKDSDC
ncbi:hypothetical protein MSP8887_03824 [Marinomonas spartinae]|uniref:Late embryogenesis abundant protein n=1 Tax=Marinomonas spartinae TaxID=1792290 RepID=A0A1A8TML6_9GAMM|nr:hypothetical protein [Marinomonas spartinae]SBS35270.1 hypothetical protein MSP8886_03329 [Marinomonas spartinae]SBS39446.1 hypothetical protein MSP8887_03824 [Marinomonas spartinae]